MAPSCKLELARFLAQLRIQDGAECDNIRIGLQKVVYINMIISSFRLSIELAQIIQILQMNTLGGTHNATRQAHRFGWGHTIYKDKHTQVRNLQSFIYRVLSLLPSLASDQYSDNTA